MRTPEEIERAMGHLIEAREGARRYGDLETAATVAALLDVLDWVRGNDHAPFARIVIDLCDQVDRAGRQ